MVVLLLVCLWGAQAAATRPVDDRSARPPSAPAPRDTTERDTTERATPRPPPSSPDAPARADTSEATTDAGRVDRYVAPIQRNPFRSPYRRSSPFLTPRPDPWAAYEVALDSTSHRYTARRSDAAGGAALAFDADAYRTTQLHTGVASNWRALAEQQQTRSRSRGGLGVNVVVPGGQQSAFSTIFGKPEVDLRVNGQANVNAGFDYRKSDQQISATGNPSQIDPDFQQDLRLGITGTIGDKMQVDVDWDTDNEFEYQNQVRLKYTGYEDEIIQSVEAGNVFLETPSTLIKGGQSLFGIKSEFQLGNLRLTTVASQQEGQAETLSIEGGSETTEFMLKPTDYDDNTHFLLSYYFRNRWDAAHAQPPDIIVANGFEGITDIEVWRPKSLMVL